MDGGNSNQGNQNKQNSNQPKSGLSWTQPANTQTKGGTNVTSSTPMQGGNNNVVRPASMDDVNGADSTGRVIGVIVGIIVVFAIAAWGIVALNKRSTSGTLMATSTDQTLSGTSTDTTPGTPTETSTTGSTNTTTMMTAAAGSATLNVAATQAAGNEVAFTNLSISQPTWVVVYESTNGVPGRILGAGLFFKGDTSGSVHLLRPTVAGQTYYVGAAVDNGDKQFVKADEKYVVDQNGAQMWMKFQAQ